MAISVPKSRVEDLVSGFNRVIGSRSGSVFGSGPGSRSRRAKKTNKRRKNLEISCFEVLDVLF
jgi:hypothetical protein